MNPASTASGIYSGVVTHRRLRPRAHFLKYRVFMLLLDLDEIEGLTARLRWLGTGRFGLMTVRTEDFGDKSGTPLREQIERDMAEAGLESGGPICLLTMPRIFGYGFNPLSVFYIHAANGQLSAIRYEVSNTFGQRHSYLMPVDEASRDGGETVRQSVSKQFHVSPFMEMALNYRFAVVPPKYEPEEASSVAITVDDAEGPILLTAFAGHRLEMTDGNLARTWIGHPLLTLKVIAGIHWEAVKLLLKGLRLRGGTVPASPVTVGGSHSIGQGAQHA